MVQACAIVGASLVPTPPPARRRLHVALPLRAAHLVDVLRHHDAVALLVINALEHVLRGW